MGFKIKKKAKSGFVRGKRPLFSREIDRMRSMIWQGRFPSFRKVSR